MREGIVGLDFGSTLVKAVWKQGEYKFASTKDKGLPEIVEDLRNAGVREVQVEGVRYRPDRLPQDFTVRKGVGDSIESEITAQVEGAKELLRIANDPVAEFLLVGMGTGTSYTWVTKEAYVRYPLGNPLGGGFLDGMLKFSLHTGYERFLAWASHGRPLDLCIKDVVPEKEGTFEGELVIANCGKAKEDSRIEDWCASLVNCVAVATARDVMLAHHMLEKERVILQDVMYVGQDVVYVGSTVAFNPVLQSMLDKYTRLVGKVPHFPPHGAFALAMGAYLRMDGMELQG